MNERGPRDLSRTFAAILNRGPPYDLGCLLVVFITPNGNTAGLTSRLAMRDDYVNFTNRIIVLHFVENLGIFASGILRDLLLLLLFLGRKCHFEGAVGPKLLLLLLFLRYASEMEKN